MRVPGGLTQAALDAVNSAGGCASRIDAALDRGLYALAAVLTLQHPPALKHKQPHNQKQLHTHQPALALAAQQRLVRGLAQYHPRLMPVHLRALQLLNTRMTPEMDSWDKATLMQALVTYGEMRLVQAGISLVYEVPGGPLPASSISSLVTFAAQRHATQTCALLWEYMQHHYIFALATYGPVLRTLMREFANSPAHAHLAHSVAQAALGSADPATQVSVAKVAYMTQNKQLAELCGNSRGVRAAQLQLEVAENPQSENVGNTDWLTDQELAGIVKHVGAVDIDAAEQLGRGPLDAVARANQYITDKNHMQFLNALTEIAEWGMAGIRLNLKLKWELLHGSFKHARRHYQNWQPVPVKQRAIGLHILRQLAREDYEKKWVAAEFRRLANTTEERI